MGDRRPELPSPGSGGPRVVRRRLNEQEEAAVVADVMPQAQAEAAALQSNPDVRALALQIVPPAVAAAAGGGGGGGGGAPPPAPGFFTRATRTIANTLYYYRGTVATLAIAGVAAGAAAGGVDIGIVDTATAGAVEFLSAATATMTRDFFLSLDPVAGFTAVGGAVANSATAAAVVENVGNLQAAALYGGGALVATEFARGAGLSLGANTVVDAGVLVARGTAAGASGMVRGVTAISRGTGELVRRGFVRLGTSLADLVRSAPAAGAGAAAASAAPAALSESVINDIIEDIRQKSEYSGLVSKILIDALGDLEEAINSLHGLDQFGRKLPEPEYIPPGDRNTRLLNAAEEIQNDTLQHIDETGMTEGLKNAYKESALDLLRKAGAVCVKRAELVAGVRRDVAPGGATATPFNSPMPVGAPPQPLDESEDPRLLKLFGFVAVADGFGTSVEAFLKRPHPIEEGGGAASLEPAPAPAAGAGTTFGGCPTCGSNGGGGRTRSRRRKSKAKKSRKNVRKSYRRGHKKRSSKRSKSRSPSAAIYASPPVPATTTLPHMESSGPLVRS
jgi:hypothetical protein